MYHTCLHRTSDLGTNDILETLPIGRQIAFDSKQGRLWVVCGHCAKWNLVPFDNRLETIDACERLFRGTKTRYSTDQIGLAKLGDGLKLIRIGTPEGKEFASWRYGRAFRSRRLRNRVIAAGFAAPPAVLMGLMHLDDARRGLVFAGLAVSYWSWQGATWGLSFARRRRLSLKVLGADEVPLTLSHKTIESAQITRQRGESRLIVDQSAGGGVPLEFDGEEADQLTARILGKLNSMHGTPDEINDAVDEVSLISQVERDWSLMQLIEARHFTNAPTYQSTRLAELLPGRSLAYEMWDNESSERLLLAGELKLLQRQWREAEELARIADGLALPEGTDAELETLRSKPD